MKMARYLFASPKQNNRKQKIEKSSGKLTCRSCEAGPPSPAGPEEYGGLLPRPTPRSCSVECMQHSTDAADEPRPRSCFPSPPLHAWRLPEGHRIHSILPGTPPPLLFASSSTSESSPERTTVETVATFLLSHCHLVQDARRRRLHRRVQAIEARSLEPVAIFINSSPEPPHDSVESTAVEPPQPAPPPRLRSG